jgi:hypothetical protein
MKIVTLVARWIAPAGFPAAAEAPALTAQVEGALLRSPQVAFVWTRNELLGAGVKAGVHIERIGSDALAPTLAGRLHVPRPPEARADPLF